MDKSYFNLLDGASAAIAKKLSSRRIEHPSAQGDTASDATTRTLAFSGQSGKILRSPHSGVRLENPSLPGELAGCYEVRQVLGQGGGDLVNSISARAHLHEEQGSDNDALNDWEILRILYDRNPGMTVEV